MLKRKLAFLSVKVRFRFDISTVLCDSQIQIILKTVLHFLIRIRRSFCKDLEPIVNEQDLITLYNVCSVHRGMFSTSGGVQYIGGIP